VNQPWFPLRWRALAVAGIAGGFTLGRAAVDEGLAPDPVAPQGAVAGPLTDEVVALPPFELDAVEPPWARDTRTAITSAVALKDGMSPSMVDALRASPGLHIDQPGGPGGRSSVYLRGGEENYTVVLLDGVPVNNSTDSRGGGFDFGSLDAAGFDAVEVVRGPVSARYGPDALSGVIKLTSGVMGAPDARAAVQAGGQGLAAAHLVAGTQSDGLMAAMTANWSQEGSRSGGNFARHEAVAAGATWRGRNIEGRATLRYGWQDSAAFPDDSGGGRYAVLRSLEERSGSATTAAVELLSPEARKGGLKWRVRSWGAWLQAQDDSPGVAPGLRDPVGLPASREATTLRRAGVSAEGAADLGETATVAVGVDAESEQGESDAVLSYGPLTIPAPFKATRDRIGAFAEYSWHPVAGWLIQPSVRADEAQDYRPRLTPRFGLRVPVGNDLTVRMNAGTGFKRPSFYAVSNPLVGNPALKPERAQAFDLGVERRLKGGRGVIEISCFSCRYRDGIDFDPGPPPRLVNRNVIRSDGAEVALRLQAAESLEFMLSGTVADVRSEPGGRPLRGRGRTQGALRVRWQPTATFTVEASVGAVGSVFDSSVPTGDVFLAGWWRADFAARYQVRRGVALTAAVDNLFDAKYEEAVGVRSPGVRLRGGLDVKF
jgi:outer membrane cobalamin receptor